MPASLLSAIHIPFACLAGMATGWALRRWFDSRGRKLDDQQAQAWEQLHRLRELTRSVAADVDEHATLMQEIGDELSLTECGVGVVETVARLVAANQRMHSQLGQAESLLQSQTQQLETSTREARTDGLTQVANRRSLDDQLQKCAQEFQRHRTPASLLLLDVDHFKKLNDTQGHQAGDEVLRRVAQVLRQTVALTPGAFVARYGGEEFAILFVASSLEMSREIAEMARKAEKIY